MTDLDLKVADTHKKLRFFHAVRAALPVGINMMLVMVAAISLVGVFGEMWSISKMYEAEGQRTETAKMVMQNRVELHQLKLDVEQALSNNNRNTVTLDQLNLYMKNMELRGVQNKSSIDTIKYLLIHKK